uniref:Uncharacterized protein n=1 Tax=viral metagenome TaxID=1070528 RepID=A0A6C0F4K6_9ZZZZ
MKIRALCSQLTFSKTQRKNFPKVNSEFENGQK